MEKKLYDEMETNLSLVEKQCGLKDKSIFLFGHCNATLELADLLERHELKAIAILDNSREKQGLEYKGIPVVSPENITKLAGEDCTNDSIVLITSRFYASMLRQLRGFGYEGEIRKLIDNNTYAEYALSDDTIRRMSDRERHGEDLVAELERRYPGYFKVFCPFNALGDIYFMISYWDSYAAKRDISSVVFVVPSRVLADVIHMFGDYPVETYEQKELDAMIQAAIYTRDENSFIAHQDRPYVINLSKALYIKKIPLETIYCCGVYGLPKDTQASEPRGDLSVYNDIDSIPKGKAVIFAPYAKSVTAIDDEIWKKAAAYYNNAGFKCYTNTVGDERPIDGTESISPAILEMRSVVEHAGTFVGIRSGLCDILRGVNADKIALYPDYNYCDTKWKAIDMYAIDDFDNIVVKDGDTWEKVWEQIRK